MPEQSDIRSRAVMFARNQELGADIVDGLKSLLETQHDADITVAADKRNAAWAQLRIGIDNMVANGFEVGYAARIDDPGRKGRSLIDRLRGRNKPTRSDDD